MLLTCSINMASLVEAQDLKLNVCLFSSTRFRKVERMMPFKQILMALCK